MVSHNSYGSLRGAHAGHIGGVEWQTYLIAKWLAERGHAVSVITWREGSPDDEMIDGIKVIKICRQSDGLPNLRFFHPRWTSLVAAMRRANAEVYYHCGAEAFTGQISHWCLVHGKRFVFSVASDADCEVRSRFFKSRSEWTFYKYGLVRADCVIVQSKQQSIKLLDNFTRSSEVLPMAGLSPVNYSGIPLQGGESKVLWVGRICEVKRPDRLLEIARQCPHIQFDVVGPPGDDGFSRSFSEDARSLSNVQIHGRKSRPEMHEIYQKASLLCCTSETEGFPNTYLEAWSYGRPVFTLFDPDGIIERNHLGMAAQDVRTLGNGIATILTDRQRLKRLGDNAREYFLAHHSVQVVLPKFEALLLGQAIAASAKYRSNKTTAMNRPAFIRKLLPGEKRTADEVRKHYQVELELADRLRASTQTEREKLYTEVYDELFQRVPHHPQLTSKYDDISRQRRLRWQIALLKRFLAKDLVFLEVGGGDCALSIEVAPQVAQAIGCDVVSCLSADNAKPVNFSFLQTNGRTFDLENESVDVAYSNQLMEHLHVDDAQAQLKEIFRVLKPGGRYVCVTPNRIGGPWDISMYFDRQATGFHMKEYTVGELRMMFLNLGCSGVSVYGGGKGIFCRLPGGLVCACERLLQMLPDAIATPLARSLPGRAVLGIRIVAIK